MLTEKMQIGQIGQVVSSVRACFAPETAVELEAAIAPADAARAGLEPPPTAAM